MINSNLHPTSFSLLNEQNERIIADFQSKLLIAERQRHQADVRVSSLDSSRETNRNEVTQLRTEIAALRQTYIALENEKDTLLVGLWVMSIAYRDH